jgi:hypothetical protein
MPPLLVLSREQANACDDQELTHAGISGTGVVSGLGY